MEVGSLISGILDFQADFVDIDDPLPKLQAESDCLIQIFGRFSGIESLELGYWAMQCLSMMGFGDFRSSTLKILRFTASTRTPSHHPTLDFISHVPVWRPSVLTGIANSRISFKISHMCRPILCHNSQGSK